MSEASDLDVALVVAQMRREYGKLTESCTIRFDDDTMARVEQCARAVETTVGLRVSRTDVLRALLVLALDQALADSRTRA